LTEQGHCVIVAAELLPKAIDWEGWWQGSVPPPDGSGVGAGLRMRVLGSEGSVRDDGGDGWWRLTGWVPGR